MAKTNQMGDNTIQEAVEQVMKDSLLKGEHVIIPDFGHLEVKLLQDRRTVFFRQSESEDSFLQLMSASKSKEKENTNALYTVLSTPLKEGELVNLPQIGIFRPIRQENGKVRISFTPSSSLRKLLNGGEEFVLENKLADKEESLTQNKEETLAKSKEETLTKNLAKEESLLQNKEEPLTKEKTGKISFIEKVSEKISVEEKLINSDASVVNENKEDAANEISKESSTSKRIFPSASRVSRVGDVIVPPDDSIIKSKSNGISGWMLGIVAAIALLIVIVMTVISLNSKKAEEEMVLSIPTESINLPSLAELHYGNAAFWIYIYEANYDKLSSPVNIPSNVSLLIPDLKNEYNIDVTDSMEIKRANVLSEILLRKNNNK